jgi:glycerophosphoryl diester phosphodiesterase
VNGTLGGDRYQAVVDAKVGRVVRLTKNGSAFYEWPGITVISHRGATPFAPENTVSAFRKAVEIGADLVEMDVRETRDGHMVIMHDETVNRTTNGQGRVTDLTLAEIRKLDAGSWFDKKFAGERVPTLEEALDSLGGQALPDIDFKAGTPEKLVSVLDKFRLLGKVTLYCGDWDLLRRTLDVSREFRIRPTVPVGRAGLPVLIEKFNPPIVNIDWAEFSEGLIRDVHASGREAFVNTMGPNDNEFGIARAIEAGADYIQSDHLEVLMPMLRSRGLHK